MHIFEIQLIHMHLEQSNEFELYDICTKFEFKEELVIKKKNKLSCTGFAADRDLPKIHQQIMSRL